MQKIPGLLLAVVLWCAFAVPAWGREHDLSYLDETSPKGKQALRFLEWERQQVKEWGLTFTDLKKVYTQSAACAAVYGECLAESDPLKAGEHTAVAKFLFDAAARLTDRQTAAREVDDEYEKIKKLTENCKNLTGPEGNYYPTYFTRMMGIEAALFFDAEAEGIALSDLPQQTPSPPIRRIACAGVRGTGRRSSRN